MLQAPRLARLSPSLGPVAGGTLITLHGDHLDVGVAVSVRLGGVAGGCSGARRASDGVDGVITCTMPEAPVPGTTVTSLTLSIDDAEITLQQDYVYTQVCNITNIILFSALLYINMQTYAYLLI